MQNVGFNALLTDVGQGNKPYELSTVSFTAIVDTEVDINAELNVGSITLQTNNDILFFVQRWGSPNDLNEYNAGQSYKFTVFIENIEPRTAAAGYFIWSHLVDAE